MQTGSLVVKDPNDTGWPRVIDWTDRLADISDTEIVALSAWAITGPDSALTIDSGSQSIVTGSLKTQLKLSGGTLGRKYTVTNTITRSSGGRDDRSFQVLIQDL